MVTSQLCKSFPAVYLRLRRFVDRGKMTYNSYMYA